MRQSTVETLGVGRAESVAKRFLVGACGIAVGAFAVLSAGAPLWEGLGTGQLPFAAAYVGVVVVFAGYYAARNRGLAVTLVGTFIALSGYGVFFGLNYVLCLGSNCPTLFERLSIGVLFAAGIALPAGCLAFVGGVAVVGD